MRISEHLQENAKNALKNASLPFFFQASVDIGGQIRQIIADPKIEFVMGQLDEAGWRREVEKWQDFFLQMPVEMEESAMLDGCSDPTVLLRIILPLSGPAMATFGLFYAVGHWNSFFGPLLYLNGNREWPVQVLLRQLVIAAEAFGDSGDYAVASVLPPPLTVKMAAIVVATTPILLLWPFPQKHFVKGIMIGSIEG